jgi:hypothetical protein
MGKMTNDQLPMTNAPGWVVQRHAPTTASAVVGIGHWTLGIGHY